MGVVSLFEGALYLKCRERIDPSLPPTRAPGSDGRLPAERLDARRVQPCELRRFVGLSRPVILTHVAPELLAAIPEAVAPPAGSLPEGRMLIDVQLLPRLGALGRWLWSNLRRPAIYMARLSGSYQAGVAHIDSLPSYNFYYLHQGRKRVIIVPRQYNDRVRLQGGYDSVFAADDTADLCHLQWLDDVPAYYDFELHEGEVLLFHNSACLHKFANLTPSPEIYTIRLLSFDASPRILLNDVLNWEGAKFFASTIVNRTTVRDTYSV